MTPLGVTTRHLCEDEDEDLEPVARALNSSQPNPKMAFLSKAIKSPKRFPLLDMLLNKTTHKDFPLLGCGFLVEGHLPLPNEWKGLPRQLWGLGQCCGLAFREVL